MKPWRIPAGVFAMMKEVARHLLRRPVVGIVAAARTRDGRWLLVRRADLGQWALAGGTLEWGETLRECALRELAEEAGVDGATVGRLLGVFSDPDRDPRFHAVTVLVACAVDPPTRGPQNLLEIREARLFADGEVPALAMRMSELVEVARRGGEPTFE